MDSVMVYNRYTAGLMEKEYYIGTRFDNVRVELTKGANIRESGLESADSCLVKIPNGSNLPKPYKAPREWLALSDEEKQQYFTLDPENDSFFAIVMKPELGIEVDLPEGLVDSSQLFYQSVRNKYGYTYIMKTVDVYRLIPRFEVSGA